MLKILVTPPVTAEHKQLLETAGGPEAEFIYKNADEVDAALMQEVNILFGNVAQKNSGCFSSSVPARTATSPPCRKAARSQTQPGRLALPSASTCSACC